MYSNRSVNDKSIYKESQMYTYYLDENKNYSVMYNHITDNMSM